MTFINQKKSFCNDLLKCNLGLAKAGDSYRSLQTSYAETDSSS